MGVEGTALRDRQSLQGIEPGKHEVTESVVASRQDPVSLPGANQFPGVTDGIRAGSAGIGDEKKRAAEAKGVGEIERLALRLVMRDA